MQKIKEEPAVEFELELPEDSRIQETINSIQNEESFECKICLESFLYQSDLLIHSIKHKSKTNKQEIITREKNKIKTKQPVKTKKEFKCTHCPMKFPEKKRLIQHSWKHRSDRKFNCLQCKQGFNAKRTFEDHQMIHKTSDPRPLKCDLCPRDYSSKKVLQEHLLMSHTSDMKYKCNECTFATKTSQSLYQHKQSHSKLFSCPNCSKKFSSRTTLKTHELMHTEVRNYACPSCDRKFASSSYLRNHINHVHVSIKKFACHQCPATFKKKDTLKTHGKVHENEVIVECPGCSKSLLRKNLKKHMQMTSCKDFKFPAIVKDDLKMK